MGGPEPRIARRLACLTVLGVSLVFPTSAAAAVSAPDSEPPLPPTPTSRCSTLSGGPRLGGTLNSDQWMLGAHARLNLPCLGGVALESVGHVGFGGNHMTLRPSVRLLYEVWIGGPGGFGIYPALGASFIYYFPVGAFATYCQRFDVDSCRGFDYGIELGGGLEYHWVGLEVIAGLGGLPTLTIAGTATFPIWDGSNAGGRP